MTRRSPGRRSRPQTRLQNRLRAGRRTGPSRETDAAPTEPYRARGEEDLVAMVPLVLGFHPSESVVVMTFGSPGFHARVDLPGDAAMLDGADAEVAQALVHACVANRADRAAVVIYTDDHARARRQGEHLVRELHEAGLDVVDVLRVAHGRWFEPLREDEAEAGPGTPFDLSGHRFTARHVYEGHAVRRDREELRGLLVGGDDDERDRMLTAIALRAPMLRPGGDDAHAGREARWVRQRVRGAVSAGRPLGTGDAARMLVCVLRADVRDAAWVDLRRENAADHVQLWLDLVRRSPEETLAPACALLALSAYLAGDGALAWCAVDRAGERGHSHSLVRLVADALTAAVHPEHWPVPDASALPLLRAGLPARPLTCEGRSA